MGSLLQVQLLREIDRECIGQVLAPLFLSGLSRLFLKSLLLSLVDHVVIPLLDQLLVLSHVFFNLLLDVRFVSAHPHVSVSQLRLTQLEGWLVIGLILFQEFTVLL